MTLPEFLLARIAEDETRLLRLVDPLEFVDGTYTVRWGERVAADCRARRNVVDHARFHLEVSGDVTPASRDLALSTLRFLATLHHDHPDYREEWKP